MRLSWLQNRPGAMAVIVVFGGWGLGPGVVRHLSGDADVLWVEDYRDLSTPLPDLRAYRHRSLVAFSFGVAAYGHWQAGRADLFDRRVAVCGSPVPVDRVFGIPPAVFRRTRDRLTSAGFVKFAARCHGHGHDAAAGVPVADLDALGTELDAVAARGVAPLIRYDRIWIARGDRIFPLANLRRAWAAQAQAVRETDAPHAAFWAWHAWDQVLA